MFSFVNGVRSSEPRVPEALSGRWSGCPSLRVPKSFRIAPFCHVRH
jgi:hypothetical protein